MTKVTESVRCGACFLLIDEPPDAAPSDRKPCPSGGSVKRDFHVLIEESISAKTQISVKQKRPGQKKPIFEEKSGDDFHRDTGTWRTLVRVIDRLRNRYFERITDPEIGGVYREEDQPLTEHTGHGSAKRRTGGPQA
jgi:hypothetical protein